MLELLFLISFCVLSGCLLYFVLRHKISLDEAVASIKADLKVIQAKVEKVISNTK